MIEIFLKKMLNTFLNKNKLSKASDGQTLKVIQFLKWYTSETMKIRCFYKTLKQNWFA